ncbi:MAG: arsenate reductase ArsC [Candidatus Omnitrophica bacterium]|nr:arsenate reductase ArsC [Candidatus Omnitrophota bacterium]
MNKERVLFVCIHNSARSQMAEAFLKQMAPDRFFVESAGIEPGILNPLVIEVMRETGIDISQNKTKSLSDFFKQGNRYEYVISVCDAASSDKCPIFPNIKQRLNWIFDDPSCLVGDKEAKLVQLRNIRDRIRQRVQEWVNSF